MPKKSQTQEKVEVKNTMILEEKVDKNPLLINDLIANRLYLMEKSGNILYEWNLGMKKLGNDATIQSDGRIL
jgi:hypothetical protein